MHCLSQTSSLYAELCDVELVCAQMCLAMCEWGVDSPWQWGGEIAQSWRMSGDHTGGCYCCSRACLLLDAADERLLYHLTRLYTGVWASTKSIIQSSAEIPAEFSGKPFAWNDMDVSVQSVSQCLSVCQCTRLGNTTLFC